ncbi:hypothetical protein [Nannocystis pusilla]|uniref:Uncharacterized protein n=1 Tax=Nannocystis pusilla TaxID=889268 RepID=A0ABS7TLR2_9BACT|nr:hypothetical protein [Nannocystis pusilla]MBZ5709161.1 hypothetical protein [Nannocystis pusilla]
MRMRVNEYTWIHTSIFALATAFITSACDEAEQIEDEDLAVEAVEDEETPEAGQVDGEVDALTDLTADGEEATDDEVRRRRDDDDDHGRRRRRHHRHGRRHHDDDGHGRHHGRHDDGHGRHHGRHDDGHGRY